MTPMPEKMVGPITDSANGRLTLAARSTKSNKAGSCSLSANKNGDRSTRVARSPLSCPTWAGLVMKHSKATQSKKQSQKARAVRGRDRTRMGSVSRPEDEHGVLPCDRNPLVATVCGCGSAASIVSISRGAKRCPMGRPWACPFECAPCL